MTTELSILKSYTDEQIQLLKSQIAPWCNDLQLKYFLSVAKRSWLDPISNQIYCIMRKTKDQQTWLFVDKMTIQTGIDGFRAIAERSWTYAGQTIVEFLFWKDKDWNDDYSKVINATVWVKKVMNWQIVTTYETALLDDYMQTKRYWAPMWLWTKPKIMLAKCAEALALRKAFPNELSWIYSEEEWDVIEENLSDDVMKVDLKPFQKREFKDLVENLKEWWIQQGNAWIEDNKFTLQFPPYIQKKLAELFTTYKKNMWISDEQAEEIWKTFEQEA
jgi:phage recombination protein Bet